MMGVWPKDPNIPLSFGRYLDKVSHYNQAEDNYKKFFELGSEEVIPLLKLKGVGRVRGRSLFKNGIRDIAAIKKRLLDKQRDGKVISRFPDKLPREAMNRPIENNKMLLAL